MEKETRVWPHGLATPIVNAAWERKNCGPERLHYDFTYNAARFKVLQPRVNYPS